MKHSKYYIRRGRRVEKCKQETADKPLTSCGNWISSFLLLCCGDVPWKRRTYSVNRQHESFYWKRRNSLTWHLLKLFYLESQLIKLLAAATYIHRIIQCNQTAACKGQHDTTLSIFRREKRLLKRSDTMSYNNTTTRNTAVGGSVLCCHYLNTTGEHVGVTSGCFRETNIFGPHYFSKTGNI